MNPSGNNGPRPITEFQFPAVGRANAARTPLGAGQSKFQTVVNSQTVNQQNAAPPPSYTQQQPEQAAPAPPTPTGASGGHASGPSGNIITWGGVQMDASVQQYAEHLSTMGLSLSSGYRTPEHNAAVNGVPNSYHLTGRALDFSGSSSAMNAGAAWARANGATEVLIHNAGSGMHLHVAW